ncbi:response regulator transcription factor [Lapillicoccus jejuensis]
MILSVEPDLVVVGEAGDGAEAVRVVREQRPDVVLMDVQMPVMDGIEATRAVVAEGTSRVVILTTFDRDDYLADALRAGASGFLLKNAEAEKIVDAVRVVGSGHALLAPEVTMRVIEAMRGGSGGAAGGLDAASSHLTQGAQGVERHDAASSPPGDPTGTTPREVPGLRYLTPRERETLVLVGRGLSNAEIAAELVVGEATVKTHVSNLLAKLHLRDRVQAVVLAHEAGLMDTP